MGSLTPDSIRSTNPNDNNEKTMPSFSYETSFTSKFSSSSSTESRMSRATSVSSELDELLYQSFNMSDKDKMRLYREFYYPPRISASGNYYPRYKGILKREHPMYLTCRDLTSATWFPVATVVIPRIVPRVPKIVNTRKNEILPV